MFTLFPFLLPVTAFFGRVLSGPTLYLAIALGCTVFGFFLGWKLEALIASKKLYEVEKEFADYKLVVVEDVARSNQETVSKLTLAQQKQDQVQIQLRLKTKQLQQNSTRLQELLNNEKSPNRLSPGVLDFLNQLRFSQTNPDH